MIAGGFLFILKKLRANNQIRIPRVIVIDEQGKSLGVLNTSEALALAQSKGLDLVEVNPAQNPSITKIMDYGKYLYKKSKAERKSRSRQKGGDLKSVRFAYRTGIHDLEFKAKKIDSFIKKNHKVKIDMILRGREKAHPDIIKDKLNNFLELINEKYKIEQKPKKNPQGISLIISKDPT